MRALAVGLAVGLAAGLGGIGGAGAQGEGSPFVNPVRLGAPLFEGACAPLAVIEGGRIVADCLAQGVRSSRLDDPSDYTQQIRRPAVESTGRRLNTVAPSFALDHLWGIGANAEELCLLRVLDNDWQGAERRCVSLSDHPAGPPLAEALGYSAQVIPAPEGICLLFKAHGLWCLRFDGHLARRLEPAALDAAVPRPPEQEAAAREGLNPRWSIPDHDDWELEHAAVAADERVFFTATRRVQVQTDVDGPRGPRLVVQPQPVRYVFELSPAGEVTVRFGPERGWSPEGQGVVRFLQPKQLALWPAEGVVAVLVGGPDFGWADLAGPDRVVGDPDGRPHAWQGLGLMLLPLDGPGEGWISLTDAVIRRLVCRYGGYADGCGFTDPVALIPHPDGAPRIVLPRTPEGFSLHALELDLSRLDRDEDGLSAQDEAAVGASDYLRDTDGGGSSDFAEVMRLGTDPLDRADDPARRLGEVVLSPSPLVRLRLPAFTQGLWSAGTDGPICADGRCYGPDGALVGRYDDLPGLNPRGGAVAADGSHVVVRAEDSFYRVFFADGRRELLFSLADAERWFTRDRQQERAAGRVSLDHLFVVPVDARRAWVGQSYLPGRVVLLDGGEARQVFDQAAARCAAGLGPCDVGPQPQAPNLHQSRNPVMGASVADLGPLPVHDLPEFGSLSWVGYEPQTEQLLVGLYGNWETWVIALAPEGPPEVVSRQRELLESRATASFPDARGDRPLIPAFYWPLPGGLRLTDHALTSWDGSRVAAELVRPRTLTRPFTVWGDTPLVFETTEPGIYRSSQVYELVRHTGRLTPGDTLVLSYGRERGVEGLPRPPVPALHLYHGPARGSLRRIWTHGGTQNQLDGPPLLSGLVAADVTADGRLCATDGAHVVTWYGTSATGLIPSVPLWRVPLAGAIACAHDAEGLLALTAQPPALHRFDEASGAFQRLRALDAAPEGFLRAGDLPLAVRFAGPRATDLAGAPLDPTAAWPGLPDPALAFEPGLRPDGLILRGLAAFDPFTGRSEAIGVAVDGGQPIALVVPGGTARDPWTGAGLRGGPPPVEDGAAGPQAPQALTVAAAAPAGGGCAVTGRGDPGGALWLLALALGVRRRWRRPAPGLRTSLAPCPLPGSGRCRTRRPFASLRRRQGGTVGRKCAGRAFFLCRLSDGGRAARLGGWSEPDRSQPQERAVSSPLFVVLIGPHGAGKSSLVAALAARLDLEPLPELGQARRRRALRRRRTALSRDPQFDWGVMAAELRRDQRLPRRGITETWHPGNLAYASLRSPGVARAFQAPVARAARAVPGVVVLPVTASPAVLARRLREPGGSVADRLAFFRAVADRSQALAVRWGLPCLPPLDTGRPLEACVERAVDHLERLLRRPGAGSRIEKGLAA